MEDEAMQRFMAQIQSQQNKTADEDYPQYPLHTFIASEQSFHALHGEIDATKERAFTIANKADTAMKARHFDVASKMSFEAYKLDPFCLDAWRYMIKAYNQFTDGDSVLTSLRELLNFARRFYQDDFHEVGMFYSLSYTRPYMRILCDLAELCSLADQLDSSTYFYEEMLRLNHRDNMGVRDELLCCYLQAIGRARRFPEITKPVRTIDQARQLINCVFDDETNPDHINLFEKDNLCVTVAELCFLYAENGDWKKAVREENEKNPLLFKVIIDEVPLESIQPEFPNMGGYVLGNKTEEVRYRGKMIKRALSDWPDFVIEIARLLTGKRNSKFEENVRTNAPYPDDDVDPQFLNQMRIVGENFLQKGRESLTNKDFKSAFESLSLAKRGFFEAQQPARKFYVNFPFAVISNRATADYYLQRWSFLRMDIRFTLAIKPDHEKTYLKLPKLGTAFNATQLMDEFNEISRKVKMNEIKGEDNWKTLAARVIGLTSITALSYAAANQLTEQMKEELIKIGIEDCYTTANIDYQIQPLLPWLKPSDMEQPITR